MKSIIRVLGFFALGAFLPLAACEKLPDSAGPQAPTARAGTYSKKSVNAQLTGYNHTNEPVGAFYVNGEWGGNISAHGGGGSFTCCVTLPNPWQAGFKVTVEWEDNHRQMHKRDVLLPQYDPQTLSAVNVHFLRSGEIKVFANRLSLWHPDYPLVGEEAELTPGVPIEKLPRQNN